MLRILIFSGLLISFAGYSQRLYRGIVVDSVSMKNIPDVHVSIKNTSRGIFADPDGSFQIVARATDTLIFTSLGYTPVLLPLLFQEDVMMVLMKENVQMLANIVVRSTRLYPNKVMDQTKAEPKKMDAFDAVMSPIDYFFWREERDRRKLAKYIRENNRTQTYRQVVLDPDVTKIMMETYKISEDKYYALLSQFNERNVHVHYFTDPDAIMEELHTFIETALEKEK
ncbi:MAG: carboxypeptidase-like regulatory domain-containing protein [Cyclobacteriaceae bacterium]|nr:MAG: carboxypeptidase-like regulatory domain-containing protein [Cyclobacteriaceae bacterium]